MTEDEIERIIDRNLESPVPIRGMNNHMGSAVTSDSETMQRVMRILRERGLYFIDSVTTDASVAEHEAALAGVPFARRTGLFLDNVNEIEEVRDALEKGLAVARRDGEAILIGHVQSDSLLDLLSANVVRLKEKGYTFRRISEYPSLAL